MAPTRLIIGLVGKIGAGKTEVSRHLAFRYGFRQQKFAFVLKEMLLTLGLTMEHVEGKLKEVPCDLLGGQTPRYAMITLGTEWGRQMINPNLWVNAAMHRVSGFKSSDPVVFDDCRFANEAQSIRDRGGYIIRVHRPDVSGSHHDHVSESEQDGIMNDYTIRNEGNIPDLKANTDLIVQGLINRLNYA